MPIDPLVIINPDTPPEVSQALRHRGFETLSVPECARLAAPLQGHPDLQVFILGRRACCHPDISTEFIKALESRCEVILGSEPLTEEYPGDVAYNVACTGAMAFHRADLTPAEIKTFLAGGNIPLISVSQGYSRCSTLIVDERRIITADRGIHSAAIDAGGESLLVSSGSVSLPGYKYGFLGGASGTTADAVYLAGDIRTHPDHEAIMEFIASSGKELVALGGGPLLDLGSLLFVE